MSGGFFNYDQYHINCIADSVENVIQNNNSEKTNDWDEPYSYGLSDETIVVLKEALNTLRKAAAYAQRIDWLLSGDDGEDSFHKRLKEDFEGLKQWKK